MLPANAPAHRNTVMQCAPWISHSCLSGKLTKYIRSSPVEGNYAVSSCVWNLKKFYLAAGRWQCCYTRILYIEIWSNIFLLVTFHLFGHTHNEWVYMPVNSIAQLNQSTHVCCCRIRLWQTKWQNPQSAKYCWGISQHGWLRARWLIYQGDNTVG